MLTLTFGVPKLGSPDPVEKLSSKSQGGDRQLKPVVHMFHALWHRSTSMEASNSSATEKVQICTIHEYLTIPILSLKNKNQGYFPECFSLFGN